MAMDSFHNDFILAKKTYPKLEYDTINLGQFKYKVTGLFPIVDVEGTNWGTFHASIYFRKRYPFGFAILQEVSHIIPRHRDRHISDNGECCFCGPVESMEMENKPVRVLEFINGYVIPFFANQIHFDRFGYFVNGAYSHDEKGLWESYEELFNTKDRKEINNKLSQIKSKPSVNDLCPCGSRRKIKKCHPRLIRQIRRQLISK